MGERIKRAKPRKLMGQDTDSSINKGKRKKSEKKKNYVKTITHHLVQVDQCPSCLQATATFQKMALPSVFVAEHDMI